MNTDKGHETLYTAADAKRDGQPIMGSGPGGDGGAQGCCSAVLGELLLFALVMVGIVTNI